MPIEYSISNDGHVIHAIAKDPVTPEDFVNFELTHAIDKRLKPPISELLEIESGALHQITKDDMAEVLAQRKRLTTTTTPHRCAIVIPRDDIHSWDIAKFYEGMVLLHSPEVVIIFGDLRIAKIWLGIEKTA